MNAPAVSICIPLYMKERFVRGTIESILAQTFTDFELVVLDNCGTDRSREIVESFDDPRIRLHRNDSTVPGMDNIRRVVALSSAPLVKIVAADDVLHPTVLERQVAILRDEPGIALVSCRQNMIGAHDEVIYRDRSLRTPDLIGRQSRATVLRRVVRHGGNPIGALLNVTFRRSAYEVGGGTPDAPFTIGDLAIWMAVLKDGDFFGMPETLVDFRIADGSASTGLGTEGINEQSRYITELYRADRSDVRVTDLLHRRLRDPLMRARHQLILSAAGPAASPRTRLATGVLKLSRSSSGSS